MVVSRGGILLENWRGHEERITLTLPCGATRTPLHELHSATCVQHVGIWLCVCTREKVRCDLCAHICVCVWVFAVLSRATQAAELYDLAHSFPRTRRCFSSDHPSECLCTWKLMRRSICYARVYVECVWVRLCKIICIRTRSRGLASCWFSSTFPEACKSG